MLMSKRQIWEEEDESREIITAQENASQRAKAQRSRWVGFVCLVVVATVLSLTLVSRHAALVAKGYELVKLQAEAAQLEKDNEALRLEIARLKSPQRITDIAVHRLGMVQPHKVYYAAAVPPVTVPPAYAPATPPQSQAAPHSLAQKLREFLGQHRAEASRGQ